MNNFEVKENRIVVKQTETTHIGSESQWKLAIKENNTPYPSSHSIKSTKNYHVLRSLCSLVLRFDLQAIDFGYLTLVFVSLDANFWISFRLHPQNCRIHGSRGCLGCCTKPPFITIDNKPTGNLGKDQVTNKQSILEDFWSSSTYEMDNSVPQSQISVSSISNAPVDAQCSSGNNPSEFVNHGFLLWNQTRQQWIGDKESGHSKKAQPPVISWKATYDNLLGTDKRFSRPIPLPEMVTFLVEVWEQEGLYD